MRAISKSSGWSRFALGGGSGRLLRNSLTAYVFLIPTFALIIVFSYYPAFSALYHSFTDWNGFAAPRFILFDNFEQMVGDRIMVASLRNMLIITHLVLANGVGAAANRG